MFELDLRSRLPIYEQLVEKIKEQIINDVLKTDEKFPSVRQLAGELTINPNTIQKAFRELERQGYIYSISGKGNFVAPIKTNENAMKIKDLKDELVKLISEVMYLGMSKDEIINITLELNNSINGGRNDG
jgi:GntR family transcriptional regulator